MSNQQNPVETLVIEDKSVKIDPENLRFNESTLTQYIQVEGGHYDHFGAMLAYAERALQRCEMLHEKVRNERFIEAKERGAAVALAEAKADVDPIVCDLAERCVEAKYAVARLKRHLMAWDKNHDNAQSLGHMLRKEMDKLHSDIKYTNHVYDAAVEEDYQRKKSESHDDKVDSLVGSLDLDELEAELAK